MCPLIKSNVMDQEEFDGEVQCLYELGDPSILYDVERKKRLKKIREEEEI